MDEIEAVGDFDIPEQEVKNGLSKMRDRNGKLAMPGMWVSGDHEEKRRVMAEQWECNENIDKTALDRGIRSIICWLKLKRQTLAEKSTIGDRA